MARHLLLFGDLTGWFYALDASDGSSCVWRKRPEEHEAVRFSAAAGRARGHRVPAGGVMGGVALAQLRVSVLHVPRQRHRVRMRDGSIAGRRYTIPTPAKPTGKTSVGTPTLGPSGAGMWGAPTLDVKRRRLYVTTGNNYSLPATTISDAIMALDLDTGRIVWSKQVLPRDVYNSACSVTPDGATCPEGSGPDYDFGSPAILVRTTGGRELLLAGQKSGMVWAVDPDRNGEIVWQTRVGQGGINGGVQWGMASDGEHVYAAASDAVVDADGDRARFSIRPSAAVSRRSGSPTARLVWRAAPAPCGDRPNCSPAQSAA